MGKLFEKGARVAFIGDSITRNGLAVSHVQNYYLKHLPEREVRIYNLGIAGDTATGALDRLDEIMSVSPTEAVVMFGVNDMGLGYYGKEPTEAQLASRESCRRSHTAAICRLVRELEERGIPVTLSSAVGRDEHTPAAPEDTTVSYGATDALLAMYRANIAAIGEGRLKSTVDYLSPLGALQAELAAMGAPSLFLPDRTHPSFLGQEVMARIFLASQGLPVALPTAAEIAGGWRLPPLDARVRAIHCVSQKIRYLHWIYPRQKSRTEGMDRAARIAFWLAEAEKVDPTKDWYARYCFEMYRYYAENAAREPEYAEKLEALTMALYDSANA